MYQIKGKIQGTADLLFNQMTLETQENLRTGKSGGKISDSQRMEEAKKQYPIDENGNAIVTSWMFKQVLASGAKAGKIQEGRKNIAQFIIATVFVDGYIHLTPKIFDYIHEYPGKRPPKTGGACLIKRPAFKTGWIAEFTLNVLDDRRNPDQIRMALEEAGILVGMGSWRPEFGRFIVIEWEVLKKG